MHTRKKQNSNFLFLFVYWRKPFIKEMKYLGNRFCKKQARNFLFTDLNA
jgi:hypothetical protein